MLSCFQVLRTCRLFGSLRSVVSFVCSLLNGGGRSPRLVYLIQANRSYVEVVQYFSHDLGLFAFHHDRFGTLVRWQVFISASPSSTASSCVAVIMASMSLLISFKIAKRSAWLCVWTSASTNCCILVNGICLLLVKMGSTVLSISKDMGINHKKSIARPQVNHN